MIVNWSTLWMNLFDTTEFLGVNIGFWASMACIAVIVVMMNLIFWTQKKADTVQEYKE